MIVNLTNLVIINKNLKHKADYFDRHYYSDRYLCSLYGNLWYVVNVAGNDWIGFTQSKSSWSPRRLNGATEFYPYQKIYRLDGLQCTKTELIDYLYHKIEKLK